MMDVLSGYHRAPRSKGVRHTDHAALRPDLARRVIRPAM